jgi:hypothetical protein
VREPVVFSVEEDVVCADVYHPAGLGHHPGIVLALGANDLGGRDPRAIALADALTRSGFVVLVMTGARTLVQPEGDDPADLARAPARAVAAFNYLAQRADVADCRLGFVGVCLGGGVCLLTASQPALAGRVAFVFLIGPYFSLRSVLRAIVSGTSIAEDGLVRRWSVQPYAVERVRAWLIRALEPHERAHVKKALQQGEIAPQGFTPIECATFQLLGGVSPERADALIDGLGERFLNMLVAASPMGQLTGLGAPTFIMHDVSDGLIPVEESRRLVRTLRGQVPLRYAEFEMFDQVDATRPLRAGVFAREAWRLAAHIEPLMRFAS